MARRTTRKTTRKAARKSPATRRKASASGRKKTASRKKTAARSGARATSRPGRIAPAKDKARSKSDVYGTIAEQVGISKKEVAAVFDTMGQMIAVDLKRGNAEVFNVPGLMKVVVQRKPATKARKGINPFTGEPTTFKAKPARNVVKVRPLKGLKDMV